MTAFNRPNSLIWFKGFPHSSVGKEFACNAGDRDSIPGSGKSPGEGNGIHCSILAWKIPWTENPSSQNQKVEWWLSGAKENGGKIAQGYKLSIIR